MTSGAPPFANYHNGNIATFIYRHQRWITNLRICTSLNDIRNDRERQREREKSPVPARYSSIACVRNQNIVTNWISKQKLLFLCVFYDRSNLLFFSFNFFFIFKKSVVHYRLNYINKKKTAWFVQLLFCFDLLRWLNSFENVTLVYFWCLLYSRSHTIHKTWKPSFLSYFSTQWLLTYIVPTTI